MPFTPYPVAGFGGGLHLSDHPAAIPDNAWTFSDGWKAKDGCAETLRAYSQIHDATWLPAGQTSGGIVPDLISAVGGPDGSVLLIGIDNTTKLVSLYRLRPNGTLTTVTAVPSFPSGDPLTIVPMAAVFLGSEIIACGVNTPTQFSVLQYDGGQFSAIAGLSAPLKLVFIVAAGGRLIGGVTSIATEAEKRKVRVSDANSNNVWDAAISNTADTLDLPGFGVITGMAPWRNGGVVLTQERVYALSATGGVSPFNLEIAEERGSRQQYGQRICATPYGIVYDGDDDIYPLGGPGVGRKIYPYLQNLRIRDGNFASKMLWSQTHGALLCPHTTETLAYDPIAQAWWRRTAGIASHDMAVGWDGSVVPSAHWFISTSVPAVFREDTTGNSAHPNNFVDTKDFSFGTPIYSAYVDRIKVDWEPLTNAGTDTLQVQAVTRTDLHQGLLGAPGLDISNLTFTTLGTLTGGTSELPVRLKGKFIRFRFKATSGRARIRGFTIYQEKAGER